MSQHRTALLLFESAKELGLKPKWQTSYGVFSIKVNSKERYLFYSVSPLNSELASYFASNKHASRIILENNNLPNIPYILPENYAELREFYSNNKPVIIKPTRGRRSNGVKLVSSQARLRTINYRDKICEKYISGTELRYLVINNKVVAVQERKKIKKINLPKHTYRINYTKSKWSKNLCKIALKAMESIGLNYGAVDFIVTKDKTYILEINSQPGMFYFENPHEGQEINISKLYIEAVVDYYRPGK